MAKYIFFVLYLFLFCLSLACEESKPEISTKIESAAREIVSKMTDEEKAGQVIHIAIPAKSVDEKVSQELAKIKPGGVILFGMNLGSKKEIRELTKSLQMEMKKLKSPPLFISTDQEGGRVIRVETGVTQFPGAMAIGQTNNPSYAYNVGLITSYELKRLGINIYFAPNLDVNNNPENPVINTRSFGSSLERVTELGTSYEKGARAGGAIPVIKHFPGHGDTNVDSHLGLPVIQKTEEELMKFELVPFRKSIELGARAIMSAHIVYPKLDPILPATISKRVLTDLLRNKLQFNGLVFTDAMEMDAISKNYQKEKRGSLAILAGADVILLTSFAKYTKEYFDMILESLKKGEFNVDGKNLLDEALVRQISLKIESGVYHSAYSYNPVADESISEYVKNLRVNSYEKYGELKTAGIAELNRQISRESIRSYKEPFKPYKLDESKEFLYIIRNENIQDEMINLGIPYYNEKKLPKLIKKKKPKLVVIDTKDQADIDMVAKIIAKTSGVNFILLHYGSPFLNFPEFKNVKIIFSFSPTRESMNAILNMSLNTINDKPIPVVELILKKQ